MLMLCILMAALMGSAFAQELTGSWSEKGSASAIQKSVLPASTATSPQTVQYSQYYSMSSSGQPTGAQEYSYSGQPSVLYVGPQQKAVSYNQYQSYANFAGGNSLWIMGTNSWTQYAQVPQGAYLSLLAMAPSGGSGYFYEIYPSGRLERSYYNFYPSTRISFFADEVGQHVLLFVVNNQASNAVIIDVGGYYPGSAPGTIPPGPSYGTAKVNIVSNSLKGYSVYVDDVYQFTEGDGGIPDGYSSFTVPGNMNHKISIKKGGYYYSQTRYFQAGREYTLRIN